MKKIMLIFLASLMVVGCAACGNNAGSEETTEDVVITDATELLTNVWNSYGENEKFFAMGGHYESPVDDGPGKYDLTKAEDLSISFCIPTEAIEVIDDAATIVHAMNANNFSAAVYHVTDPANKQFVVDAIKDQTINNQWMCGFPEKLKILIVNDEYVVTTFGTLDNVETFATKVMKAYENNVVLSVDESLVR